MFVSQASFEIDKNHEDRLIAKSQKNQKEIAQADGLISYECWRRVHAETVEFVFVSKWNAQADFQKWISREEHVQEHKEKYKEQKASGVEPQVKMKKTLSFYEVFEASGASAV
ncbi:antibiotic biosynthesis monooxygenase family protein [Brevibacillus dissolubilis]|uniref:antibiotic biosynthesis monooxygenase family protein n=1 Tax=Brevibacillus dissolubilis TaxID=1844116 RepID=UPI001115E062|nr:antibiotic biosynthesis monooxygenase [Brevibacillus dissolubilis]